MAWRGTNPDDVVLATLAWRGPVSVTELRDSIDPGEWERASRHEKEYVAQLSYQNVLNKLHKLKGQHRVVKDGKLVGKSGAWIWRLPNRQEVEAVREEYRRAEDAAQPQREHRLRAEAARDFDVEFCPTPQPRSRDVALFLLVKTKRGDAWVLGETWDEALDKVGL